MLKMSEEVFKKFLVFLASNLNENKELLKLVQKRYDECGATFRISADFKALVDDVQAKMEDEKHRIFVHLKDFLAKLKSLGSSSKKRKREGHCNNTAKRLFTGNSCSDVSSDSDFFQKVKKIADKKDLKDDPSSVKSDSPKDVEASNSPMPSSTDKKTDENAKVGMGKSNDKAWPISDEEEKKSLSLDSVRSDTKSSDNSDLPLGSNSKFPQKAEPVVVDSVSSESKCSPSTSKLSLNTKTNKSPLPNLFSEDTKTAITRFSQSRRVASVPVPAVPVPAEPVPVEPVVIEDDEEDDDDDEDEGSGSGSDMSLPSPEVPEQSSNETKDEGTLENADSPVPKEEPVAENAGSPVKTEVVDKEAEEREERARRKKKKGSDRQIKRLEKLLGEIRDEIEKSSEKELSLDDLEKDDSSYVYEDRLQKKFIKVWEKLCSLKNQTTSTGRPIEKKFRFNGTRYAEVNKRIEKFINKKKIFPDYNDIKKIISQVNGHYKLYLGKTAIEDLAREAFTDVGNQLQERRHRNFILTFGSSQTESSSITKDPALFNQDLRKKLAENRKLAKNRLDEVVSQYAKKQYETNAQPEEVDENAPESSDEEEEEEEPQHIPELDEVLASSDEDEASEIPAKASAIMESPFKKKLKVELEKLIVPHALLKKKPVPSSTAPSPSSTAASKPSVDQDDSLALAIIPNTSPRFLPSRRAARMSMRFPSNSRDAKAASDEMVIDLDSSSDADDSAEVIEDTQPARTRFPTSARLPTNAQFPTGTRFPNSALFQTSTSNTSMTMTPPGISSTYSNMVMSSQNNMQFSMQVKTQYQQQQKDGSSLKIASVSSLAYSIKDSNSGQYFSSQQTNFQNQGIHSNTYKQRTNRVPSNSVIVLSDSD